jgi:hypothetical protein
MKDLIERKEYIDKLLSYKDKTKELQKWIKEKL